MFNFLITYWVPLVQFDRKTVPHSPLVTSGFVVCGWGVTKRNWISPMLFLLPPVLFHSSRGRRLFCSGWFPPSPGIVGLWTTLLFMEISFPCQRRPNEKPLIGSEIRFFKKNGQENPSEAKSQPGSEFMNVSFPTPYPHPKRNYFWGFHIPTDLFTGLKYLYTTLNVSKAASKGMYTFYLSRVNTSM